MNKIIRFILNNELISIRTDPAIVLLDFIRKQKHLKGTKEGCKEGDCGACTVLSGRLINKKLEYHSVNSCLIPLGNIENTHIVTIEGLCSPLLNQIQNGFIKEGASQCGFCTPGFIVSLTGYLLNKEVYDVDDCLNAIAGNICRCTGYSSIRRVVYDLLKYSDYTGDRITSLIQNNILPGYFTGIAQQLEKLEKAKTNDHNKDAKYFIGGGTDIYVQKPEELLDQEVCFIKDKNLSFINADEDKCCIGAGVTFQMIKDSSLLKEYFPKLDSYLNLIASLPVRNSATIGGNIINASPIGDFTIFFLALNASINLNNRHTSRKILLKNLFKGYKQLDKNSDEYLESVEFKLPAVNSFFNFEKVSKRTYLDIASVNSAVYIEADDGLITDINISAGGVAPVPLYLEKTSAYLRGKDLSAEVVLDSLPVIQSEIKPINDIRGSADYKRLLLSQLFKAHFSELFPELISIKELL
jgi:xanthine dehydrogenase small subunit